MPRLGVAGGLSSFSLDINPPMFSVKLLSLLLRLKKLIRAKATKKAVAAPINKTCQFSPAVVLAKINASSAIHNTEAPSVNSKLRYLTATNVVAATNKNKL